jgi:DNA-binding LacI/PurR family transcriptional regulator
VTTLARPGRGAATLIEVAARAGVSRATASRVLRGSSNVSPEARDAVLAAAAEIHYTPNRAARSLVTGRSDSIAFVVTESEERTFTEPFFLGMLRSAQETVAGNDLQLTFVIASTEEQTERFINYATSGHVDGVLLLSMHGADDLQVRLEAAGVPTVLSGRPYDETPVSYVDADNVTGGRIATEYLLERGHRVIATISGPMDMCAGRDRLEGYREAMAARGLLDEELIESGGWGSADGFEAATRLIRRRPDIEAIFAGSDLAAIGAIRALQAAGRRVPEDVAVIGFDDLKDATDHVPALTTVRQPVAELGASMARLLMERLAGTREEPAGVVLPVELVVRDSA